MRRVLDLNICRYDVYSCIYNVSERQNGSAASTYDRSTYDDTYHDCCMFILEMRKGSVCVL